MDEFKRSHVLLAVSPCLTIGKERMPQDFGDEKMHSQETKKSSFFATVATPAGRGAIATILVTGHDIYSIVHARFRTLSGRRLEKVSAGRVCFGYWRHNHEAEEEVVVARDQNTIEIQCHGGSRAAASILASLRELGCTELPWTDWLRRQAPAKIQEEATRALAKATTRRTASLMLAQYRGVLSAEIQSIMGLVEQPKSRGKGLAAIRRLIDSSHIGLRLVDPWCVVVAGPPNVGKSSLINALAGFTRSIVYHEPGTTRDLLQTAIALDGWPIQLIDTAGLRTTADAIERLGISRATASLADADLILLVQDASLPTATWLPQESAIDPHKTVYVMNKIDVSTDFRDVAARNDDRIWTSAVTGAGLAELRRQIVARLIPNPPQLGSAFLFTKRQLRLAQQAERLVERNEIATALAHLREIDRGNTSDQDAVC